MKGRPVYLRASGHYSARGNGVDAVCDALLRGETGHALRTVTNRAWPYFAFSESGAKAILSAETAVCSVRRQLREKRVIADELWHDMPLFIGSSSGFIGVLERSRSTDHPELPSSADFIAQIANWFGVRATPWCFSTACTSSLAALDAAATLIASGAIRHAVVLGIELANDTTLAGFASLGLLTAHESRPLDRQRDGMVLGEAVAGIFLSSEAPSELADSPTNAWRLAGLDMRLDAHSMTGPRPDGAIIAEAMQRAMAQAGLTSHSIDLVKLQASGNPGTDQAEAAAISNVFGNAVPALLSLKPYFGHTMGASGAVELSALLACLDRGWLPATPGFAEVDPEIGLSPTQQAQAFDAQHVLFNLSGFGGCASAVISREGR